MSKACICLILCMCLYVEVHGFNTCTTQIHTILSASTFAISIARLKASIEGLHTIGFELLKLFVKELRVSKHITSSKQSLIPIFVNAV